MNGLITRFSRVTDCNRIKQLKTQKDLPTKIIKYEILQKEIIIAIINKKVVGIIKFEFLWKYQPFITLVYVGESYRRQGVGTKMMQFLEKYLIKKGYSYLFTSSYEEIKTPHQWYYGMGFKPCGFVEKINLPENKSREIFFFKKLTPPKCN